MISFLPLIAQIFGPSTFTTNTVDQSFLFKGISSGCPVSGPVSCQTMPVPNTCCTEYPGGLLMQTQFWDTDVPRSPPDSWTIHGLWPDFCDATWTKNCDPSRAHYNITELLTEQGATSTLDYMRHFWLDNRGNTEHFWNHEWRDHGTCCSTLEPSCLPRGSPEGSEAVAYFQTIVKLFQTLPTYTWLADAGITPSDHRTYTLSELLSALEQGSGGYTPALRCRDHKLVEVHWYHHLKGSLVDGEFVPIDSPEKSACPPKKIQYLPKEG
ncbi:ribonuclease T2 [Boletus coccyginus]|nr:ribonuclease T2 [Boletus coccyginus]